MFSPLALNFFNCVKSGLFFFVKELVVEYRSTSSNLYFSNNRSKFL